MKLRSEQCSANIKFIFLDRSTQIVNEIHKKNIPCKDLHDTVQQASKETKSENITPLIFSGKINPKATLLFSLGEISFWWKKDQIKKNGLINSKAHILNTMNEFSEELIAKRNN